MTSRGEPPLARLTAVFAVVVAMAACSDTAFTPEPDPAPAPAPAPAPEPDPEPAPDPGPDPLESLPAAVLESRTALLSAAQAGDWDALGALIPTERLFTSVIDVDHDHIAYYRSLETDVLAEIIALLEGPFAVDDGRTVWPEVSQRTPFTFGADERADLEARFGAERVREWEAAGTYLGWRLGIDEDGTWVYLVAGD